MSALMGKGSWRRFGWLLLAVIAGAWLLLAALATYFFALRDYRQPLPAPASLGLPEARPAIFHSKDATELRGWYVPGSAEHIPIVVVHGIALDRVKMLYAARIARGFGHPVLLFDLRHHGESDGGLTSFGAYESEDVIAAAETLKRLSGQNRIALWGLSLGAASVLMANGRVPGLAALIAECPYDDMSSTFVRHAQLYAGWPAVALVPGSLAMLGLLGGFDPFEVSPLKAAARSPETPMLVLGGEDDVRTPPEIGRRIAAAHGANARFVLLPGTHALLYDQSPALFTKVVGTFLAEVEERPRGGK